jgi:hypothetical protein
VELLSDRTARKQQRLNKITSRHLLFVFMSPIAQTAIEFNAALSMRHERRWKGVDTKRESTEFPETSSSGRHLVDFV